MTRQILRVECEVPITPNAQITRFDLTSASPEEVVRLLVGQMKNDGQWYSGTHEVLPRILPQMTPCRPLAAQIKRVVNQIGSPPRVFTTLS